MNKIAKALTAALVAGYAVFETVTMADSAGGESVVANEWVRVAVSTIIAGIAVWAIPNEKPKPDEDDAPKQSQP